MALVTRSGKGSPLTIEEIDNNFTYLEGLSGGSELQDSVITLQNEIDDLQDQINNIPPNDLQSVTDAGNTTSTNIVANGGIEGSSDYAAFNLLSPYYNDMKWFRFSTTGDGTDFSVNSGVNFVMNPEEGLYIQRYDYDNNIASSLYLAAGNVGFNNSYGTYSSYLQLDEMANINLSSNSFAARLRTDLLTDNRTFQFPDEDGTISTKEWIQNYLSGLTFSTTLQSIIDNDDTYADWAYGVVQLGKKYDGDTRQFAFETTGDDGNVSSDYVTQIIAKPDEIKLNNYYAGDGNSGIRIANDIVELISNYEGGYNTKYRFFPDSIRIENQQLGTGYNYNCNFMIPFMEDGSMNRNLQFPLNDGTLATIDNITMQQASTSPNVSISTGTGKFFDVNFQGAHRAILAGSQSAIRFYINRGSSDTVSIGGGRIETYNSSGSGAALDTGGALRFTNTSGKQTVLYAVGTASDIGISIPVNAGTLALLSDVSSSITNANNTLLNTIVKQTVTNGVTSSCPSQDAVYDFVTAAIASSTVFGTLAPSSSTDTGVKGEIRCDSTYLYICVDTNTWVRTSVNTW